MDRSVAIVVAVFLTWLVGCSGCEDDPGLQVADPHPHTRCLAAPFPEAPSKVTVEGLSLTRRERRLEIAGTPESVRIAAFAGPGMEGPAGVRELDALVEREPTLAIMLGGLGDDDATASETVEALAAAPFPTLFVPGGRDDLRRIRALLPHNGNAMSRVVDLSGVRVVVLSGGHQLIPISGASDGRYALNEHACGFSLRDLQAVAGQLPPPGKHRYLLSWEAPGRGGTYAVARSRAGLDLGSDDLAEFALRVGAPGGLFAWPYARVAEPATNDGADPMSAGEASPGLRVVVPRLTGMPLLTVSGARVPAGFLMLTLGDGGLSVLGRVEVGRTI